ncbi:ADP-ribosylglycohydrolase family protein [Micromonospora craniellae]|uniref:ADP-ribosylglycohydrolase family protein n=1 Tax=Micromonospora craniellae TaxID=2294034 RepID=UPI001313E15B|nr:ADP-ribosylglycohydrolase family protein [Micromonospora craniellae]QOC91847.1 ADP-ribosylglycohydrolase family protein [Micromonospora craniellae]
MSSVVDGPAAVWRVAGALTAYACGDALGVPYEGRPPTDDGAEVIETPRASDRWAAGATSDDTALTLLVAGCLVDGGGDVDAVTFLSRVAAHDPPVPGAGPSTRAALAAFRATGAVPDDREGGTNGAPMRALPVGWSVPPERMDLLVARTVELTRATHRAPEALVAAVVMAGCASWSVAGVPVAVLLDRAAELVQVARPVCGDAPRLAGLLGDVVAGGWSPPPSGVGLDAAETVAAVLHCVRGAASVRGGLVAAVRCGGDTDTVAALVGGLLGARSSAVRRVAPVDGGCVRSRAGLAKIVAP